MLKTRQYDEKLEHAVDRFLLEKKATWYHDELDRAGLFDKDSDYEGMIGKSLEDLMDVFSKQGHSGMSASWVANLFKTLVIDRTLSPITGEDDEWVDVTEHFDEQRKKKITTYQNKRRCSIFKEVDENGKVLDSCDIEGGPVFRDKDGCTYTNSDSVLHNIEFPYTPPTEREIIDVNESKLTESKKLDKNFFDYKNLAEKQWQEAISDAIDRQGISFNTENDYGLSERRIKIPVGEDKEISLSCRYCFAGGDWEYPIGYFRCQVTDGMFGDYSQYRNSLFVLIPGKNEGNPHLVKTKSGKLGLPDSGFQGEGSNERLCWKSLPKLFTKFYKDMKTQESIISDLLK